MYIRGKSKPKGQKNNPRAQHRHLAPGKQKVQHYGKVLRSLGFLWTLSSLKAPIGKTRLSGLMGPRSNLTSPEWRMLVECFSAETGWLVRVERKLNAAKYEKKHQGRRFICQQHNLLACRHRSSPWVSHSHVLEIRHFCFLYLHGCLILTVWLWAKLIYSDRNRLHVSSPQHF